MPDRMEGVLQDQARLLLTTQRVPGFAEPLEDGSKYEWVWG